MFSFAGKTVAARFARMRTLIAAFRSDKRANTAIIFALAALPLVSAVGCVVDYSMASMIDTKLQAAADAATLASISNNSPILATAKSMSGNGTVSGSATYVQNFYGAETSSFTGVTYSGSVSKTGQSITATMTYSYQVPTSFMKILGYPNITVTGSSTASYSLPVYINFYLMLDVSGSMSFPSTAAEQARLMAVNPDNLQGNPGYPQGCQFACHFSAQGACAQTSAQGNPYQGPIPAANHSYSGYIPNPNPGGYCQGFTISRLGTTPTSFPNGTSNSSITNSTCANGATTACVNWTNTPVSTCSTAGTTSCIQLRADAVGYAVTSLLSQASTTETNTGISNQFQVGLFPFIQNLCTSGTGSSNSCSVGLTTSLTGSTITTFAQQLANLLDTGTNTTLGSGGTHFENALKSMNSFITSVGTGSGSGSNALPYVFIVTDGSQDYQTQMSGNWGSQNWTSNGTVPYQNSATVIPPNSEDTNDYCGTMKNRGITVAVLYIPYQPIQDPSTIFNDEDGYANANIANIPTALTNCASSGFFYTASTPTDIQNALVSMFNQAVSTAHISQ
jgi:Flp pilus assembly protein TadG